jgi:hypothetical protein
MSDDEEFPTKRFRLQADIAFDAEDVDHALSLLAAHFASRAVGWDGETWFEGRLDLSREPLGQ